MNDFLTSLAQRYGLDVGTLDELLRQLQRTEGRQAQFNHPALGGFGQWQSGMLMIGAMNDHALKARVAALFEALIPLVGASSAPEQPQIGGTSPGESRQAQGQTSIGTTGAGRSGFSGSQNNVSYRYDSAHNQLILNDTDVYDTTGYRLRGVNASQQSGGPSSLVIHTDAGPKELRDFRKLR